MKNGHSNPVNATAARVISNGTKYEYAPDDCHVISDTPLSILNWCESPTFKELTGINFGRMTVIGYSATHKGRWVCRCACGNYVLRKTKTIKLGRGGMCEHCSLMQQSKRNNYARRTGQFMNLEDFNF